jgi:hypothetical protein
MSCMEDENQYVERIQCHRKPKCNIDVTYLPNESTPWGTVGEMFINTKTFKKSPSPFVEH